MLAARTLVEHAARAHCSRTRGPAGLASSVMSTSAVRPALRVLAKTAGVLALTAVAGLATLTAAAVLSPWPSALIIRRAFTKGGWATNDKLASLVPDGVTSVLNIPYRPGDRDALLDIHRPSASLAGAGAAIGSEPTTDPTTLPTIVWIHGGGWVAGSKDETANYLRILAAQGFVVVVLDYTLAPRGRYPLPLLQVRDALGYLTEHAADLDLNMTSLVLAGDSAGSQIAAQVALAVVDEDYAQRIDLRVPLPVASLKATVLHCGAYDLAGAANPSAEATSPEAKRAASAGAWFQFAVLWAYSGSKHYLDDPRFREASVAEYVTDAFPPTFLSGGNADPLTPQGKAFAHALETAGVEVTADFAADDHEPRLGHEYQFDLHSPDGAATTAAALAFLRRHTSTARAE